MPLTRRHFVAASVAASSATLLAQALPAADAKKLRVVVIGHTGRGNYGHGLDTMWQRIARTQIVAVADADAKGLSEAVKRLGGVPGFADYSQMLADVRPDIVAIGPRHVDQHHAMCMAAIGNGVRGIYIEKPFCRTPREADEIKAACGRSNVKLAVAHRNRYHPALPVVQKLIAAGEIGTVLELRARGREDHRGGALDLWVLGSHVMNLAEYFAGAPLACSAVFYQNGKPCTAADIRPGDEGVGPLCGNEVHARYEMASGVPFFFDSLQNRGEAVANFGVQIIGTKGVLDLRIDRAQIAHLRRGNPNNPAAASTPWLPVTSGGVAVPEAITDLAARVESHQLAGEDLVEAILQSRAPLCDVEAGATTVEMICAAFASHTQNGARVALPLAKREHPLAG